MLKLEKFWANHTSLVMQTVKNLPAMQETWVRSLGLEDPLARGRGLSCPTACGILTPHPGIKPSSPALEGGFLTTEPPGKTQVP